MPGKKQLVINHLRVKYLKSDVSQFQMAVLFKLTILVNCCDCEYLQDKETTLSPSESFHSAFSSTNVNLYHHMASPILSSSILLESYASFLNIYHRRYIDVCSASNGFFEMVLFGTVFLKKTKRKSESLIYFENNFFFCSLFFFSVLLYPLWPSGM